jgi:hypothetical protein
LKEGRGMMLEKMKDKMKDATCGVAEVAGGLAGSAAGIAGATLEKLNQFLEDFYDVLPTINALGLSVELMKIKFGLFPEVQVKITGALQDIQDGKVRELIEAKAHNKMLIPILQAFRSLAMLKKPLSEVGFKGIKADISIAALPNIDIELLH